VLREITNLEKAAARVAVAENLLGNETIDASEGIELNFAFGILDDVDAFEITIILKHFWLSSKPDFSEPIPERKFLHLWNENVLHPHLTGFWDFPFPDIP